MTRGIHLISRGGQPTTAAGPVGAEAGLISGRRRRNANASHEIEDPILLQLSMWLALVSAEAIDARPRSAITEPMTPSPEAADASRELEPRRSS
jgi:hypothetical protein